MDYQATQHRAKENWNFRECWIGGASMLAGVTIGAMMMYFWDPQRGKIRRAVLQQKAAAAVRQSGRKITKRAEDLLNRAKGAITHAGAALQRREEIVDDDIVRQRVRSHLGHVTGHAGDFETEVVGGIVTLRGAASPGEHKRLVDEILAVPGVKGVRDLLVSAR